MWLGCLARLVVGQTLLPNALSFNVYFFVAAEQINVLVIVAGWLRNYDRNCFRPVVFVGLGGITCETGKLSLVGGNVLVPSGGVGVLSGVGGRVDSPEADSIGLRGRIAVVQISVLHGECSKGNPAQLFWLRLRRLARRKTQNVRFDVGSGCHPIVES